eukprot:COSAG01_NODE_70267_length_259_cov_0.631250_1_plen_41_part_01
MTLSLCMHVKPRSCIAMPVGMPMGTLTAVYSDTHPTSIDAC